MQETDLPATNAFKECKFHCTNGNCLRLGSLICNQLNNCGDNSDEENCPVVTQHPPPGIFNSGVPGGNPRRHGENKQSPHRKAPAGRWAQTQNPLAVRQQC
ncbi:low-density lipoprotein receptor class A domain-containing protein 4-like isoform X1 [Thunnus maccoyii]|uniref:low-density lipoprotein receptor class A domain-containing protein 4-like isoform X1 n=1 Tax=Thunnus maccoyii TaxID=8240 RepID=UPI001C4BF478|nr:low-density lipoprotein receptor class A domain-containing protein 4-like isoform X1 [Thunnus maccoyii]